MTVADAGMRRILLALLAAVLLFGAVSAIGTQGAEAAYPGGSDWIVFENTAGDAELWVVPADGSDAPTQLTNDAFFQADPVFSPDGTKIAFASDHEGQSSIYVASFDPSVPSLQAQGSWTRVSSGGVDGEPTWSPDGTEIAFERWFTFYLTGTADLTDAAVLLDDATVPSGPATFVTDGVAAGMSVSNTTAATSGAVVSVAGETQLTTDIAWTAGDLYSVEVVHARVFKAASNGSDSGSETQLGGATSTPAYTDRYPAWDPQDGTLIALATSRNGSSDVYTVTAAAGTAVTNLTSAGTLDAYATRPAWSPGGDRVAFQIKEPDTVDENIWTVGRTGGSPAQVTSAVADEVEPAWSSDGTQIAYRNGTTGEIFVVASGGGTGTALTTAGSPAGAHNTPNWQPTLKGVDDAAAVAEHGTVDIDVLANDLDLDPSYGTMDTSATLVTAPTRGTATRDADGSFIYEHTGPEIGTSAVTDTFEYTITQGSQSSTAEVTVTINPVDDDPTADADGPYPVSHSQTINITAGEGVLVGDSDPEGLGLSAVLVTDVTKGTLSLAANGSFTYTHDGASTLATTDSFTYQAKDPGNNLSNVATVTISIGAEDPDPPVVAISGPSVGAPGVESTFEAAVTDGSGPRSYAWSITAGGTEVANGTSMTIDYTPAVTGAHIVTVTVEDDAGLDTDEANFTVMADITGHTFVNDIVWLANEGITKGCNPPINDEFCPNDFVTRGQMAAFLVRFLGLTDNGGGDLFADDDGSIFEENIDRLATAGITKGCNPPDNTNFCPEDYVTRGQMAAFLVRALGLSDDGGGNLFGDDDGSIFEASIDKLATAGITRGCNPPANTSFCPNDLVTRGQMARFLKRADGVK